jgi:hypothetical protein
MYVHGTAQKCLTCRLFGLSRLSTFPPVCPLLDVVCNVQELQAKLARCNAQFDMLRGMLDELLDLVPALVGAGSAEDVIAEGSRLLGLWDTGGVGTEGLADGDDGLGDIGGTGSGPSVAETSAAPNQDQAPCGAPVLLTFPELGQGFACDGDDADVQADEDIFEQFSALWASHDVVV